MKRPTRRQILYCIGAVALAISPFLLTEVMQNKPGVTGDPVAPAADQKRHSGGWVYGSRGARFTIVEYADLECPYCKDYFPHLKAWVDQHPDVNLQWHHLPLPMHEPAASYEARWAECAGIERGNGAFWLAVELIYQRTRSNGAGTAGNPQIPGLEDRQTYIDNCASSNPAVRQTVVSQAHKAGLDGITATPTLVIKDKQSGRSVKLQGAPDGDVLLSAMDWLIARPAVDDQR
ncbi:DsbA family, Com1-like subfamily protein [Pseudomonas syringae pv. atrofaciens]|jgi:protein-disulfide isomerase|uniref:Protein-disulfide isomerase n=3 Tax=Pseudomonas syringae TaxID=317 RepID=A0A0P9H3Q5_PSESX|nr:thioredoxin domain-containing protein [Pseudomonas syringae]AVX23979.1 protein-disulfide isomerase [Pseudomonas syringae pv. atrofaciens]ELS43944.1 DsbA family, Com1-like subfamily protein [Pseudomonas syringae pv. syringae B64]EPF65672.1 DsbA family, Com1-like subfamily protein [Pseudomonas syringae pv. syringae SM]KPW12449.1 DsbA family, Com1-like subfamily protein [Pseudomonas syringae pv. atrofaciens]OBS38487.1 protein-disulfide isomerase [Pseudomonas syringae pv. syringae]